MSGKVGGKLGEGCIIEVKKGVLDFVGRLDIVRSEECFLYLVICELYNSFKWNLEVDWGISGKGGNEEWKVLEI